MNISRRHALSLAASVAAGAAWPAAAQQDWPQRSLRILIGTTPGGSPDIVGRLLADKITGPLGQPISVENNTGGGGGIAAGIVSNSPPDGYNMTLLTAGFASGAAVGKFKYDGDSSFGFITMVCSYPFVYAVPKDSPIQSFPDMLARAKANMTRASYREARMRAEQAELDARLAEAQVLTSKSEEQLELLQSRVTRLRKQLDVQP